MDIVPAFLIHSFVPGGALYGPCRRDWWSCGRTGIWETGATDPAPVCDIAVGAPGRAIAIAVAGAIIDLASHKITVACAEVRVWKSDGVDHRGRDGGGKEGKPSG